MIKMEKRLFLIVAAVVAMVCNLNAQNMEGKKVLVAYFSATGNTVQVAQNLAQGIGADLFEIKPEQAYTKADLDWHDKQSRSSVEMADKSSRPKMANQLKDAASYDIIYLGFPIWWYTAPTIVNTFLESGDFSGKTIVLFATSGGSRLGNTKSDLQKSAPKATFIDGEIFSRNEDSARLANWAKRVVK